MALIDKRMEQLKQAAHRVAAAIYAKDRAELENPLRNEVLGLLDEVDRVAEAVRRRSDED